MLFDWLYTVFEVYYFLLGPAKLQNLYSPTKYLGDFLTREQHFS